MQKKEKSFVVIFLLWVIAVYFIFNILYIWKSLIIPFIVALLFSSAIIWLSGFYQKIIRSRLIATIFSLLTYIFVFWIIGTIISANVDDIIDKLPEYQKNFESLVYSAFDYFDIKRPGSLEQIFAWFNLQQVLTYMLWAITSLVWSAGIIFFYTLFILLESSNFNNKLSILSHKNFLSKHVLDAYNKAKTDIKWYFYVKFVSSATVWLCSYMIMLLFWLHFSAFWWLLIFLLNFVPFVWSIIAVIFPSVLSLVQTWFSPYDSFFLITLLIVSQSFVANFLEPKLMGNRLNLSPLVIIISLWFWGSIWWVLGILLSVPIMVIINIIFSKIEATRPIAIILSEKWVLSVDSIQSQGKNKFSKYSLKKLFKK